MKKIWLHITQRLQKKVLMGEACETSSELQLQDTSTQNGDMEQEKGGDWKW